MHCFCIVKLSNFETTKANVQQYMDNVVKSHYQTNRGIKWHAIVAGVPLAIITFEIFSHCYDDTLTENEKVEIGFKTINKIHTPGTPLFELICFGKVSNKLTLWIDNTKPSKLL